MNMKIVDVHCHLDIDFTESELDDVIKKCESVGIVRIISNGTHPESNRRVIELDKKYNIVKSALGFYPTHVQEVSEEEFDKELKFIKQQKPIALGEVGLDYKWEEDVKEEPSGEKLNELKNKQIVGFKKFVNLSKELNIPLIIHTRKAEEDVLDILEEMKPKKVVLHCFCGKRKLVDMAIEKGYTFSIPVTVIKLEQFQELVKKCPLNQLLTETDAPYLGPTRGERNDSSNIILSIKKIAEIKGMDVIEVSNQLFMNYMRMFNQ